MDSAKGSGLVAVLRGSGLVSGPSHCARELSVRPALQSASQQPSPSPAPQTEARGEVGSWWDPRLCTLNPAWHGVLMVGAVASLSSGRPDLPQPAPTNREMFMNSPLVT